MQLLDLLDELNRPNVEVPRAGCESGGRTAQQQRLFGCKDRSSSPSRGGIETSHAPIRLWAFLRDHGERRKASCCCDVLEGVFPEARDESPSSARQQVLPQSLVGAQEQPVLWYYDRLNTVLGEPAERALHEHRG